MNQAAPYPTPYLQGVEYIEAEPDSLQLAHPIHPDANETDARRALAAYAFAAGLPLDSAHIDGILIDLLIDLRHLADAVRPDLYERADAEAREGYSVDRAANIPPRRPANE